MENTANPAVVHWSTGSLPERDRIEMWRELVGRRLLRLNIEPSRDRPLEAEVSVRSLPGLRMSSLFISRGQVQRRSEYLADGSDDLALHIGLGGATVAHQRDREVALAKGEACLLSASERGVTRHVEGRFHVILVPRNVLAQRVRDPEAAFMQPIPRSSEALKLLMRYLNVLREGEALADPRVRGLAVTHAHDLIAVMLGATRDAAQLAARRGLRAARLNSIKQDIDSNLSQPGALTVSSLAARNGISPRYVQMLFEGEGTTFSEYVLELRLARAKELLGDPRYASSMISTIAYTCGFSDHCHFDHAFRRRYGASPSEFREAAEKRF